LHILLVEDNLVNQRLAVRLLEKQGHIVRVANNGREAVTTYERERFDLVLMDIQMPEMSGLEATALIRDRERSTGAHLPIIAITAHALHGDRERCLAAGMDGYISKPIQTKELFKLIAELTPEEVEANAHPAASAPSAEVFDQAEALARVEGDRELLAELAELFAGEGPFLLTEIRQAITRGESASLARAAHTLKGSVGNFGAQQAQALAMQLEQLGRAGTLGQADTTYANLEAAVGRLCTELSAFAKNVPA
jgi:two-component system, sensor histidine kinase and response regulator